MSLPTLSRRKVTRLAGTIFVSTCILTLDFLGVLSLLESGGEGFGSRLPFYLLSAAVFFVSSLFYLEGRFSRGAYILLSAVGFGGIGFFAVALAIEGVRFGITSPEKVLTESLIIYFLTAGLICTGLGYWVIQHWREFLSPTPSSFD